ncbi:MAG: 2Fe-2S iron-sulfur cluster-binding protein [Granulosicoccaceae bacterium]
MQFHNLHVTHIHKTIRDAVVLTLRPDATDEFSFTPGQYLTFRKEFDGEELRRSYSICAGLNDGALQVGIKRVDGGVFSTWANVDLTVGDVVEALPPMGNFYAATDNEQPRYLVFAGGSGITPILSIIKSGLQQNSHARYSLVYANRRANTIMFREEIEDLKNRYLDRFSVVHILEDEGEEIDLFRGRVDVAKCSELFQSWINIDVITMAYICGPEPMMLGIRDALQTHGLSTDQIRFELFGNSQPGRSKQRAKSVNTHSKGVAGKVTLGGDTHKLVIPDGSTLLEAAIANNIDAPFACKAGVCSSCKAKVIEGEVEMMANHALEDDQVNAGFVLTCQCLPLSAFVAWDYDQAGH